MSRFYDVLKEAERRQPKDGDRHNGNKQAPPEVQLDDVPAVDPPAGEHGGNIRLDLFREAGNTIKTALDRKVRLIPHAVDSIVVEHYRMLRTKLLQESAAAPFRLLIVASPNPQEGKTVTAVNLALSFCMLPSTKVLIVDGDLRKGTIGRWLSVDGRPGLSNLIDGSAGLEDVVLKSSELPAHFVLRGNSKLPPAELLNSPALKDHLQQLAEQYDVVIIDSPPLNLITDGQLLAQCCDAVLLVVRAYATTRKALEKAVQDLQPARVVGAVLNAGAGTQFYRRYSRYY
jgi:capsular exopolysaccharide synthesis family protein